jgi:branched-subunit amino acid transport protein
VSAAEIWALIGLCAVVTAVIKGIGPFALGGRDLPPAFTSVIGLLAAALLTALVCVSALADGQHLGVGADTAGVAVAGVALWRGASVILGVFIAAGVTAGLRALGA